MDLVVVALVMEITLHFFMLSIMPHVLLHLTSVSRSFCKRLQSDGDWISRYIKQSSANRRIGEDTFSVILLINSGTPDNTGASMRHVTIHNDPLCTARQERLNASNHLPVKVVYSA